MENQELVQGNILQGHIKNHKEHAEAVKQAIEHLDNYKEYYGKTELIARFDSGSKNFIFTFCSAFMVIEPKTFLELYLDRVNKKIAELQKQFDEL